jgi:hypothetical protein
MPFYPDLDLVGGVLWFCGNATNDTSSLQHQIDDHSLKDVPLAEFQCLSLAVPCLVASIFVLCAASFVLDFVVFLRPRTAASKFHSYTNGLLIALHLGEICLCVCLGTTGALKEAGDEFFLGRHTVYKWLAVCITAWTASLLLFLIITFGGGRKGEINLLLRWWLMNAFVCLPIAVSFGLYVQQTAAVSAGSLLFASALCLQILAAFASLTTCVCGGTMKYEKNLGQLSILHEDLLASQDAEEENEHTLMPNPLMHASWFSIVSFSWVKPLLTLGMSEAIQARHLWSLAEEDTTRHNSEIFIRSWKRQKPRITVAMLIAYWQAFLWCGAMTLSCALLDFIGPWSVGRLIFFAQNPSVPLYVCIAYVSALALGKCLQGIIIQHYTFLCGKISIRLSSALKHAIYSKMLVLSPGERQKRTAGDMVNNISVDVQKIVSSFLGFWNILTLPLQIGLSMYLLWRQVRQHMLLGKRTRVCMCMYVCVYMCVYMYVCMYASR